MSNSVRPHRQQPTRLPCPWDSPGKNTGVGCHFLLQCMKVKSESEAAQSCPTLSDPMDCSPPGSSVHGIFQARVLEWGAIAFSKKKRKNPDLPLLLKKRERERRKQAPKDLQMFFPTQGSKSFTSPALARGFFTTSAPWETHLPHTNTQRTKLFLKHL